MIDDSSDPNFHDIVSSALLLVWGLFILLSLIVAIGVGNALGCSSEDVRVGLLQLGKHLLAVLSRLQLSIELFDLVKDEVSELRINNVDDLLKYIVTEDMSHKFSYNPRQTNLGIARVLYEFVYDCLVVPEVGALEDVGYLIWGLSGLKAFLDHVG